MKIVIIEDEKLTARDLATTIQEVDPHAKIIAMLHSVEDAISFFLKEETVDLIFSDIQLGDGLSFEIFAKTRVNIPIIYCTAFNQYALDAFKTLGIDYLLKPFSKPIVRKALEKYKTMKGALSSPKEDYDTLISLLKSQLHSPKPTAIIIQQGDKITPLSLEQVALFFIKNEAVFALSFDGEKYAITQRLNDLEDSLSQHFFRANRQFLINRKAIKDASHFFNRKILIHLTIPFEEKILVSKVKASAFLNWLTHT
ncbi:MAG: LytTR family DNA-binding domain-containing protein [Bacteroidota bacterium]